MSTTINDTYLVNGVDLRSMAWRISTSEGLQDAPEFRGEDAVVPGAHGSLDLHATAANPRRRYAAGTIKFSMWVLGVNPYTGLGPLTDTDPGVYFARIDQLQRLFNARQLSILHPRSDGDRAATGRLGSPLRVVRETSAPLFGRFEADIVIPGAFWADTDATTVTGTVASGATLDLAGLAGTAPITDATVTFGPAANPMIQHGGTYLQYQGSIASGRSLDVLCAEWRVRAGTGTAWTPSVEDIVYGPGPSWLELDTTAQPLEATFTHTGGGTAVCTITAYRKWLTS